MSGNVLKCLEMAKYGDDNDDDDDDDDDGDDDEESNGWPYNSFDCLL